WAAIVIGAVAGVIVVLGVLAMDKYLDDPVGCLPAHGLAGIWGTLSCGLFTVPALAKFNGVRRGGPFLTRSPAPLRCPGGCGDRRLRHRVLPELRDLLDDQEDDRAARQRGRGAGGPGHQRARHVGLP